MQGAKIVIKIVQSMLNKALALYFVLHFFLNTVSLFKCENISQDFKKRNDFSFADVVVFVADHEKTSK